MMVSGRGSPCLRGGAPAPEHGENDHNPEEFGPVGKGSGGQGSKVAEHPRVVRCRSCHSAVHLGEFRLKLSPDGSIAKGYENGMVIFERGVEVRDELSDSRFWSDEHLASVGADGEEKAPDGVAQQCNAAFEVHRR